MSYYNYWYRTTVSHIIGLLAISDSRSGNTLDCSLLLESIRLLNLETKKNINNVLDVLIDAKRVVAIGECGLDHPHYTSQRYIYRQAEVFENQFQLAKGKDIAVVIHGRGDEQLNDLCLSVTIKTLPKDYHIYRHHCVP